MRMHVFIHNFTYIEKGVKCRDKKFIYPKCLKVRFPNLYSSQTISALARTLLEPKNISMNLGSENSTFQHMGNNYYLFTNPFGPINPGYKIGQLSREYHYQIGAKTFGSIEPSMQTRVN